MTIAASIAKHTPTNALHSGINRWHDIAQEGRDRECDGLGRRRG